MSSILVLYLLIETLFIVLIIKKYQTPNVLLLGYLLFYIYAQSPFIYSLISGNSYITFNTFSPLDFSINSDAYLMASTCYFLFMLTYGLIVYFRKKDGLFDTDKKMQIVQINFKFKILILFLISYMFFYFTMTFEMDRVFKKQFSIIPFDFIIYFIAYYLWAFLFLYSNFKNIFFYLLTFAILLHSVYSFEREYVVFIALVFLFKHKKFFKGYKMIFVFSLGYIILSYWKQFYIHSIINSNSLFSFFESISLNSFQHASETNVGMSLLTQYFENNIYNDYYISYVTNTYNQFIRIFFDTGYNSIAEFTTNYYTQGRMGTAFSMILESILNFGLLGPIILPVVIIRIILKIIKKKIHMYDFYSVFLLFMMLKLVRTELTVLLKLYILPFLIFGVLLNYVLSKKVKKL